MAIDREDIEGIAKEVALRVTGRGKACRCGLAFWDARSEMAFLDFALERQDVGMIQSGARLLTLRLKDAEANCQIDVEQATNAVNALAEAVGKGDWDSGRNSHMEARRALYSRISACAYEETV